MLIEGEKQTCLKRALFLEFAAWHWIFSPRPFSSSQDSFLAAQRGGDDSHVENQYETAAGNRE
jgi:hypothetical protein